MKPLRCAFEVVLRLPDSLLIEDTGTGGCPTVTNDAEALVKHLLHGGVLRPGMRLLYYDSEGKKDEILFDANGFKGFKILRDNEAKSEPDVVAERPLH